MLDGHNTVLVDIGDHGCCIVGKGEISFLGFLVEAEYDQLVDSWRHSAARPMFSLQSEGVFNRVLFSGDGTQHAGLLHPVAGQFTQGHFLTVAFHDLPAIQAAAMRFVLTTLLEVIMEHRGAGTELRVTAQIQDTGDAGHPARVHNIIEVVRPARTAEAIAAHVAMRRRVKWDRLQRFGRRAARVGDAGPGKERRRGVQLRRMDVTDTDPVVNLSAMFATHRIDEAPTSTSVDTSERTRASASGLRQRSRRQPRSRSAGRQRTGAAS